MRLMNIQEHLGCYNYDHSDKPIIEVINYPQSKTGLWNINDNEVAFLMEGRMRYSFRNSPTYEVQKGQFLFLPAGSAFSYLTLMDSVILVLRVRNHIKLCECYHIEKLYSDSLGEKFSPEKGAYMLEINSRLWHFLTGLCDCIGDGIKCKVFFEMKIKEFFLMLRAYYPKENIYDFLYPILSRDPAFSEYVRKNWPQYKTVKEIADALHQTPKQFSKRFKEVFDKPPYKWIKERKANAIYHDICSANTPLKQIAAKYGFSTIPQFTKFCKTELGRNPGELRRGELQKRKVG
jgi:AraC-like DNA-binding protein